MNDLDQELRATLASPPDFVPTPVDIDSIMVAGGRLRRRRRMAVAGGVTAAVAALALATQAPGLVRGSGTGYGRQVGGPSAGGPSSAAPSSATPTHRPRIVSANPVGSLIGDVVSTGLRNSTHQEWVIFAESEKSRDYPKTTFLFAIGERLASGDVQEELPQDFTDGSDRAAGFHSTIEPVEYGPGNVQPAFGSYVGAAARITANFEGRTVQARTAQWSEDPAVTVFWFDPAETGARSMTKLTAYGSDGKAVARGDGRISGP
jgi:hypothetical protein